MSKSECLNLKRTLTLLFFAVLTLFYGLNARAAERKFSYICSNDTVYTIRVSTKPGGITNRGAWFKVHSFCNASKKSATECLNDDSLSTYKCLAEFKGEGAMGRVAGNYAFWPNQLRHNPSIEWFEKMDLGKEAKASCRPVLATLGCTKTYIAEPNKRHIKCAYDHSNAQNRAVGRNCFTDINRQLNRMTEG